MIPAEPTQLTPVGISLLTMGLEQPASSRRYWFSFSQEHMERLLSHCFGTLTCSASHHIHKYCISNSRAAWAVQHPFVEREGPGVRSTVAGAWKSNRGKERVGSRAHFQLCHLGESRQPVETLAQLRERRGLLFAAVSLCICRYILLILK